MTARVDEQDLSGLLTMLADPATLIGPDPVGGQFDMLAEWDLHRRGESALALLDCDRDGAWAQLRGLTAEVLLALDRTARRDCLRGPLGAWDAYAEPSPLEQTGPLPAPDERAGLLWRHLVGAPIDLTVTFVVPSGVITGPRTLPQAGLILNPHPGPLAVTCQPFGNTTLVWHDGAALQLHAGGRAEWLTDPDWRRVSQQRRGFVEPAAEDEAVTRALAVHGLADAKMWSAITDAHLAGLRLLREIWPVAAADCGRRLRGVLPLTPGIGVRTHSSPLLPGVVLSSAETAYAGAEALVHEIAHTRLETLLRFDPLLHNGIGELYASPWRADPRPLLGLLMGVHAFLDVHTLHLRLTSVDEASLREHLAEQQREKILQAWRTLRSKSDPTPIGEIVLAGLHSAVADL